MNAPPAAPAWCAALLAQTPASQQHRIHRHQMEPYVRTPDGRNEVCRCRCGFAAIAPAGDGPAPPRPHWNELLQAAQDCPQRCTDVAHVLVLLAGDVFAA